MKRILTSIVAIVIASISFAQTTGFSLTTTTYQQNFNTLDSNATNSANLPLGWGIYETGTSASVNQMYRSGAGTSNAGDTYSFGTAGNNDRALGSMGSGTLKSNFGIKFINNTTAALTAVTVTINGEQWRAGDTASKVDSLLFSYKQNATGVSDTDSLVAWTFVDSLMLNSPNPNGTGGTAASSGFALDGNATMNKVVKTFSFAINVAVGDSITLRWTDWNIGGSDDGLSLDDVTIAFNGAVVLPATPMPVSYTPADNSSLVPFTTTTLGITFDNNVQVGTGNFVLKNLTDGTNATIPVTNISTSGTNATITGISLLPSKDYAVQYDATVFNNSGTNCPGVTNNTDWNFSTMPNAVSSVQKNAISISANNQNDACVVLFNTLSTTNATLVVYDMLGTIVATVHTGVSKLGANTITINTSALAKGMYMVQVTQNNKQGVVKFVK